MWLQKFHIQTTWSPKKKNACREFLNVARCRLCACASVAAANRKKPHGTKYCDQKNKNNNKKESHKTKKKWEIKKRSAFDGIPLIPLCRFQLINQFWLLFKINLNGIWLIWNFYCSFVAFLYVWSIWYCFIWLSLIQSIPSIVLFVLWLRKNEQSMAMQMTFVKKVKNI